MPRIRTRAVPGQAVYLEQILVGQYDPMLPGTDRKMRPVEEGFLLAAQRLEELANAPGDWVAIDEVGYLEPSWYLEKLRALMERKRLLAVVRKEELPSVPTDDALVVDLDGMDMGCVVMASGLGRRFGGNKLLAELHGKPLVRHALDTAGAVFANTVVVTRYREVAALHDRAVLHDLPHRSDTVRLGLEALEAVDGCVFLPGDQPFVSAQSLYALALCAKNTDTIWQLGGGSPVVFPRWAFEELKNLPQGKGGNVLVKKYGAKSLPAPEEERRDIDTKEDLKNA